MKRLLLSGWLTIWFSCALLPAGADRQTHSAQVGKFIVQWRETQQPGKAGDVVEVFERIWSKGRPGRSMKRVYRYFGSTWDTWLDSVSLWRPPVTGYHQGRSGVVITMVYGTGSGKTFMILAETHRGFREVFSGFSDRIGDGRSLELVDLVGDGYPEIVFVPSYANFRGTDPGDTRAQVWKWNDAADRYVMVRESAYSKRLRPLAGAADKASRQRAPIP